MEKDKSFLGTQPVGKLLFKLSLPTVIAQIVNMLYNIVDRIYIGHMPGDGSLALTGVGVCLPIIMIISAFAAFVSAGGAPRASISMGKGDNGSAEKILGGCFFMQIIISAVLTALLLIFDRDLLLAFGASENTIEYAVDYMNIYAIGTVFVQLTLGMNAFITAQGFANIGMVTVMIGAVSNIVLDPIFIFGLHMGVRGAALATIISQCISCVWVVAFLFGKKTILRLKAKNFFVSPKIILPCITLGLATFIMQSSESVISVCFNSSLLKYGGDIAVGAMTILTSVMQFAMLPLNGISQGSQPILSYNYGAGNSERVKKTFKLLLAVCLTYSFLLWGFIELFPQLRRRAYWFYRARPAYLLRRALPVRHTDVVPDGVRVDRQRAVLDIGRGRSQVRAAPAAYLYHAGVCRRQDDGRLYGGARSGCYRDNFHFNTLYYSVRQGNEEARSPEKRGGKIKWPTK